jgi:hypothetical protein
MKMMPDAGCWTRTKARGRGLGRGAAGRAGWQERCAEDCAPYQRKDWRSMAGQAATRRLQSHCCGTQSRGPVLADGHHGEVVSRARCLVSWGSKAAGGRLPPQSKPRWREIQGGRCSQSHQFAPNRSESHLKKRGFKATGKSPEPAGWKACPAGPGSPGQSWLVVASPEINMYMKTELVTGTGDGKNGRWAIGPCGRPPGQIQGPKSGRCPMAALRRTLHRATCRPVPKRGHVRAPKGRKLQSIAPNRTLKIRNADCGILTTKSTENTKAESGFGAKHE